MPLILSTTTNPGTAAWTDASLISGATSQLGAIVGTTTYDSNTIGVAETTIGSIAISAGSLNAIGRTLRVRGTVYMPKSLAVITVSTRIKFGGAALAPYLTKTPAGNAEGFYFDLVFTTSVVGVAGGFRFNGVTSDLAYNGSNIGGGSGGGANLTPFDLTVASSLSVTIQFGAQAVAPNTDTILLDSLYVDLGVSV